MATRVLAVFERYAANDEHSGPEGDEDKQAQDVPAATLYDVALRRRTSVAAANGQYVCLRHLGAGTGTLQLTAPNMVHGGRVCLV